MKWADTIIRLIIILIIIIFIVTSLIVYSKMAAILYKAQCTIHAPQLHHQFSVTLGLDFQNVAWLSQKIASNSQMIIIIIMVSSYIAHIQCSVRFTHITPGHWTCSFLEHTAHAAISALGTSRTHCHLCPTRYSFTPESSEACEGKVPWPRTPYRNNVPILRGEKHDISLKNLHQAGFKMKIMNSP